MSGTVVSLGDVELDDADVQWPLYRGSQIRTVVIQQGGDRAGEFEALPYINELSFTTSSEDGRADPAHDTLVIEGVRLLEVRKLSDEVCELHLADARIDIARELFPADVNILWRDGYLNGTDLPILHDVIQYIAPLSPVLSANLAAFNIESFEFVEDGVLTSGMMMLAGLDRLCESVGYDYTIGTDGLLHFVSRASGQSIGLPTAGYNWAFGLEPDWDSTVRSRKGLPQNINVYYQQRHNIEMVIFNPRASVVRDDLEIRLRQVYEHNGQYLTLEELVVEFNVLLTDEQITQIINTNNFEEGDFSVQRDGSAEGNNFITIIKRDWRRLYKLIYPASTGARGGWSDLAFGKLLETNGELQNDLVAKPVEAEWVGWFGVAEGDDINGALLGRNYLRDGEQEGLPTAPFSAAWEAPNDDIIRLSQNGTADNIQLAWLGKTNTFLEIAVGTEKDDQGISNQARAGLLVPQIEDITFTTSLDMVVHMVGTRRLPNSREKWTLIEIPAFPSGEIDYVDLEVSDELYSLHEVGFGEPANLNKLTEDATRRAQRYIDIRQAALDGSATALGMEVIKDLGKVDGAIRELNIRSDGLVVLSEISVGNLDNPNARYARKRRRDQQRKVRVSGKEIA